jgi:IstB-like ATP binding protein
LPAGGAHQGGAFPGQKDALGVRLTFQRWVGKRVIEHLGQLDFLHARENVVLLGPPGLVSAPPQLLVDQLIQSRVGDLDS